MTACIEIATKMTQLRRYWLLVLAAVLVQILPPLGLNVLAHAAYENNAWMTPASALPLSQLWLAVTGLCGAALAVAAMYSSLVQARLAIALPLMVLCVLALGASIFYLFAFLAFQGLL